MQIQAPLGKILYPPLKGFKSDVEEGVPEGFKYPAAVGSEEVIGHIGVEVQVVSVVKEVSKVSAFIKKKAVYEMKKSVSKQCLTWKKFLQALFDMK